MSRWFRHYAGLCRDEKLVRVALKADQPIERIVWLWGAILESAAEVNDGGRFDIDLQEMAHFLRIDETLLKRCCNELETAGRVSCNIVCNWKERQYESDSSTDRVRRHRQKKKSNEINGDLVSKQRSGNVTETLRNAPETETETETDIRKNMSADADGSATVAVNGQIIMAGEQLPHEVPVYDHPVNPDIEADFSEWYAAYPRHEARGSALKAYKAARKKIDKGTLLAAIREPRREFSDPKFIPLPASWLNSERWADEPIKSERKALRV